MPQCGCHAPRRPLRRPGREPRRLLPDLVRRDRPGPRVAGPAARRRARRADRGGARAPDAHLARRGRALGVGRGRARPGQARRRPGVRCPTTSRRSSSTRTAPSTSAGSSSSRPRAAWTSASCPRCSGPARRRRARPDRYRVAIERLTVQDIAVFFQEVLPAVPQLIADLAPGSRILDVHCGGGRWLIAMARRFPGTVLTGVEFEPDSVARARAAVAAAVLDDRITIEQGDVTALSHPGEITLAYFQYALHQLPDPVGRAAVGRRRAARRRVAGRPRLVPADGSRGAGDPAQRAARRDAARRAGERDPARDAVRGARLVRGRGRRDARADRPPVGRHGDRRAPLDGARTPPGRRAMVSA